MKNQSALKILVLLIGLLSPFAAAEGLGNQTPGSPYAFTNHLMGAFLTFLWLGTILPPILQNQKAALDNTTTLVIQAMDLVFIVPLAILAGILLLRRSAWGYLLTSVFVIKVTVLGLAVAAMGINQTLTGTADGLPMVVAFLVITGLNLGATVVLLRNITEKKLRWAS